MVCVTDLLEWNYICVVIVQLLCTLIVQAMLTLSIFDFIYMDVGGADIYTCVELKNKRCN